MKDEDNFYLALKKYVELYGDDDGNVSSKVFTPLNEIVKLIDRVPCSDVMYFFETNEAFKEAYSASLALKDKYNTAYVIQIICLIEGWGCEGNAEDKNKARKMLEDRFDFLEAEKHRLKCMISRGEIQYVRNILYLYGLYALEMDLPPSEGTLTVKEYEHRKNRLNELNVLVDKMMASRREEDGLYYDKYRSMRDKVQQLLICLLKEQP